MIDVNSETIPTEAAVPTPKPEEPRHRPHRGAGPLKKLLIASTLIALAGGLIFLVRKYPEKARSLWEEVAGGDSKRETRPAAPLKPDRPWDGSLSVDGAERKAMGFVIVEVAPQTDPIQLELLGTTEYITDTLTKIRPMFKCRVDKVHVNIGQAVKKGDPLIDLYSKDLAEAKSDYEVQRIEWLHDRKLLDMREPLHKSGAITDVAYEETKSAEMKSHKEADVARDKLSVYGLSDPEIDRVATEVGAQKARMTLRAHTDGFVIERDVVPDNLYDENDTLLVIAPLNKLWVWGNVFESDLNLVKLGQSWEVRFPFLEDKLQGQVEYISNRVDPITHAVRVRTSIPNAGNLLKSAMLVRGMLSIPPMPDRTVIPRTALIVGGGHYYAYVQKDGQPDAFERRVVAVAQEKDDHAVIETGLKAGEKVVTVGALILDQIQEDAMTAKSGSPPRDE